MPDILLEDIKTSCAEVKYLAPKANMNSVSHRPVTSAMFTLQGLMLIPIFCKAVHICN